MVTKVDYGYFRGRALVQKRGNIGGSRSVFVKLQELKNEMVYPPFGGIIMNPFRGRAKFYAGDLMEYRTNEKGVEPKIYLLKTFEVADAVSNDDTVLILRDGYRHIPFVGDFLMVAPDVIGGTGTAVKVTGVTATTATIGGKSTPVWSVDISANQTISKGAILVEAEGFTEGTSATKAMLVKNINAVADSDADMMFDTTADTSVIGTVSETDYDSARYLYTPALGGLMYTHKMSPMPQCVLDLNRSNVNGWFKVNYYDMRAIQDSNTVNAAVAGLTPIIASGDPSTSTKGVIGQFALGTTSGDLFMCTAISSGATPTYTWTKLTA